MTAKRRIPLKAKLSPTDKAVDIVRQQYPKAVLIPDLSCPEEGDIQTIVVDVDPEKPHRINRRTLIVDINSETIIGTSG